MNLPRRIARSLTCLVSLLSLAAQPLAAKPVAAGPVPAGPAPTALPVAVNAEPWLYRGSNVPHDPDWVFGELPNGLRYAVRRNGVPPEQVSIRIRIDAGSLY